MGVLFTVQSSCERKSHRRKTGLFAVWVRRPVFLISEGCWEFERDGTGFHETAARGHLKSLCGHNMPCYYCTNRHSSNSASAEGWNSGVFLVFNVSGLFVWAVTWKNVPAVNSSFMRAEVIPSTVHADCKTHGGFSLLVTIGLWNVLQSSILKDSELISHRTRVALSETAAFLPADKWVTPPKKPGFYTRLPWRARAPVIKSTVASL